MSGVRAEEWAARLVATAIGLYPAAFRERYGVEMRATFEERWSDLRGSGAGRWLVLVRTVLNLLWGAARERLDAKRRRAGEREINGSGRVRAGRGGVMGHVAEDIRYTLRFLRRHPSFTVVVLLTLGLGIGMNTAVFSVLYGALYSPLPYEDASSIVRVGRTHPSIPGALLPISAPRFTDLDVDHSTLAGLELETPRSFVLSEGGQAVRVTGGAVSGGFLDLLGVEAAMGRTFTASDDVPGAPAVAVVSDAFWKVQLGGDPSVIGRDIRLDDEPYTVVGVMPPEFEWQNGSIWVPLRLTEGQRASTGNWLRMVGRLAPGADVGRASAEMASLWMPLREAYPDGNEETGMAVLTLRDSMTRSTRAPLFVLAGAALFVLLIACVNVANLMLVRAERRQREVGVRAALGAGRGRLAGQLLTEGLAIAVLGGAVGVLLAWGGMRGLIGVFGSAVPRATEVGLSVPVLVFSLVASLVTGALVGVAPALRGGIDFSSLREGSRGGTARFTRTGRALVVLEVALAIVLVTGAGLLLKSYSRVLDSNLGFEAEGLVATNFWFPSSQYTENEQAVAFLERLADELVAQPGIGAAAMASMVPIREYGNNYTEVGVNGRDATASFVEIRYVTPAFFEALGIRVVDGRNFTEQEARESAPVMVITETLARQLFGGDDPIGWQLGINNSPEIIGVVQDVRDFGPDQAPRPIMYAPAQVASNLIVRSDRDAGTVAEIIRAAARNIDPLVVPIRIESMDQILDRSVAGRRFQLALIGVFAITALLLACVGIYGVLAYTVERQTREIGVRMALGARAGAVAAGVAWRGGQLALLGVGIGAIGAYALRQTIASQLFDVQSFDPVVYGLVSLTLLSVAAVACLVPARRAAVTDPVRALSVD